MGREAKDGCSVVCYFEFDISLKLCQDNKFTDACLSFISSSCSHSRNNVGVKADRRESGVGESE